MIVRKTFEQEKAERAERFKLLASTAVVVAAAMGAGWSVEPHKYSEFGDDSDVYLRHTDGRRINLSISTYNYKGMVDVSGSYDYGDSSLGVGFPRDVSHPGISVGLTRGGEVIAKEIKRRFLPDFDAVHARIAESIRKSTVYRDTQEGITARLAALAGAEPRRTSPREFRLYGVEGNNRHVEVKVISGVVDIKIDNLTECEAGQVLQLLSRYLETGKAE
jgi:hypothetical protein